MAEIDTVQEILARLKTLQQELSFAAEAFQNGGPEQVRPSVQIALGLIHTFLLTVFGARDSKPLIPLRQLIYALHDLDRGRAGPLLAPQKTSHRPRDSVAKEAFIAIPAACMELLVEGGIARKDAANRVANALGAMGYRNGDKRITGENVEDWRDRMRTGSPAENAAVGRFRRIVSLPFYASRSADGGKFDFEAPPTDRATQDSKKARHLIGIESWQGLLPMQRSPHDSKSVLAGASRIG